MSKPLVLNDPLHLINSKIGNNLYAFRKQAGFSAPKAGSYLGVSYQQYLKYESAENRISGASLFRLSLFFGAPINSFFQGLAAADEVPQNNDLAYLSSREIAFVRTFRCLDARGQAKVIDTIRTLSSSDLG